MSNGLVKIISCEEARSRFNDFIDNYLQGTNKLELEQHIKTCKECFGRLEFEKMFKSRLAAVQSDAIPEAKRKEINKLLDALE
jgi:hypothetical protein